MQYPDSGDEMTQALLEMRALLDSAVSMHRVQSSGDSLLAVTEDREAAMRTLGRLLGEARYFVNALLPPDFDSAQLICAMLRDSGPPPGVRVQALCSRAVADRHGLAGVGGSCGDIEVRVTDAALHGAVIIDRRVALMQSAPGEGERGKATQVRSPVVVHALNTLFVSAWRRAAPEAGDRIRRQFPTEILRCLRDGYTDEAAARVLGVSVRTYRRQVADLIRALGATSRFQAGAFAVELGVLPAAKAAGRER